MAVIENRFVCDLSKPVQAQALKGNVFSLDNLGSRISVLIYENGQPATISGSVTANCILSDGSTVNVNGGLTTENGGSKAYVDIPQSCLLIPGILKIAIKCTSSSVITTLAAIVANVYMTKTDNVITPSQQIITDWNAEISASLANQDAEISDLKSALTKEHYYVVEGNRYFDDTLFDKTLFTNPSSSASNNRYWGFTVNEPVGQLTFVPTFQTTGEFQYDLCVTNNGQAVADSSEFRVLYSGKASTGTAITFFNLTTAHFVRIKSEAVPYYTTKANAEYTNARLIYCGVSGDSVNQSSYTGLCLSGTFYTYKEKINKDDLLFNKKIQIKEISYVNPSTSESNNRFWGFTFDKPVDKLTFTPAVKTAGTYSYALCKMQNNLPPVDNGAFDIIESGEASTSTPITFYNLTPAHFIRIKSEGIPYYTSKTNAKYQNSRLIYLGVAGTTINQSSYTTLCISGTFKIYTANLHPNWKGLKWVCVGDSLTEVNNRTTMHYYDYIAEVTGIVPYNMGVGGTGYLKNEGDTDNNFYTRVDNIPDDADLITIFGSGNDTSLIIHETTPLGNATDVMQEGDTEPQTICAAINETITKIQTAHPLVPFGIIAPTPWASYNPFTKPNNAMLQYCGKLKEICALRGVPYLDLYYCSNLRPWDDTFQTLAYSHDNGQGVHPDENGHKIISPRFMTFIEMLIDNFIC